MVGDQKQSVWTAIRKLNAAGPFTTHQVDLALSISTDIVKYIVGRFADAGALIVVGEGDRLGNLPTRERVFRIAPLHDRPTSPSITRKGDLAMETKSAALWRTMKMLKRFTAVDLAAAASTNDRPISASYTDKYCRALNAAGVLAGSVRGYVIVRNLGPAAPRVSKKSGKVYDPNAGDFVGGVDD